MAHYGTDKLTKHRSSNGGEFTLYVNNLPAELNQHGLLQIFSSYGHVKAHFYRPNTNWAYVTYDTFLEAENAIRELHDIPPLRLKISFAKERSFNDVEVVKVPAVKDSEQNKNHGARHITLTTEPLIQTKGRGKPLDVFKKIEPNPGLPKYTYTPDSDLLYPYPLEPYTYNPYENADPYASTNTLWTRGNLTITPDGKRHVSLGRGYTRYEIPYPDPEIENHVDKIYEKRTSGLYEYGQDMLQNAIGTCKACSKKTKFTCERCHTFYCSRNCQISDWPQHKLECENIPALVMRSVPTSETQNEEQTPTRNISNIQIPLRRPKNLVNAAKGSNEILNTGLKDAVAVVSDAHEDKDNSKNLENAKTPSQQNMHPRDNIEKKVMPEQNHSSSLRKPIKQNSNVNGIKSLEDNRENIKNRQKFNVDDVKKMEEDISFSKQTFLSKTQFTDVRIVIKMNRELWIQKVEDEDEIMQLMNDLQHNASKAQKVKELVVGNMYAVQYEGVWHRVVLKSLNPQIVHFMDYGNDEIVKSDDYREIPKYKNVPKYCAKIRLSEKAYEKYKSIKYEDVISVKAISVNSDKVIEVEIKNENDAPPPKVNQTVTANSNTISDVSASSKVNEKPVVSSETSITNKGISSSNKLKSVVSTVGVGDIGVLEVHAKLKNNTYSITLLPNKATSDYEKLLIDLPEMCIKEAESSNHKPNTGDWGCGRRFDGDWLRGYIVSLEPTMKMAIVDEARVMPIDKTVACSETFSNICAFGAVCEVIDAKCKLSTSGQYEFKTIAQTDDQNKIEVEILQEGIKVKAIVKSWTPFPEQNGLQYAELKSGHEVALTAYRSPVLLFARPLDIKELEYYNHVMQNVAKCAQTSPCLKEQPVVGQMVVAQYVDDNYYRAIVTKVQSDNIAISYIDFGNTEITNIKKLKILSDDLKQLRSCTTKIILKDVPNDVPMTKEVNDYLSNLVGTELPLTCTFEGVPSKDGVYLKLHNGEDINKNITELLMPASKKTEEDKTCYMEDDISVIDLGNIGDTIEVLILHTVKKCFKYAMCPIDHDLMSHIFDIMPRKMTDYCEASKFYIPRDKELCLALYEGGWYRATCICRSYTATSSAIFFVDFGNMEIINHKDIRLMPKEFTTPNALASICNIINLAPTDSKGQYSPEIEKRISELVVPDNFVKVKIVERDFETGMYNVELPLVRTKLIEEGLISA